MLLAGLGRTHALTSQRLGLLQLHDNLLRRVLRDLPHGRPFCPATSSRDYLGQPSQEKWFEKPDPFSASPKTDLMDRPADRSDPPSSALGAYIHQFYSIKATTGHASSGQRRHHIVRPD